MYTFQDIENARRRKKAMLQFKELAKGLNLEERKALMQSIIEGCL